MLVLQLPDVLTNIAIISAILGALLGSLGTLAARLLLERKERDRKARNIRLVLKSELEEAEAYLDLVIEIQEDGNSIDTNFMNQYLLTLLSTRLAFESIVDELEVLTASEVEAVISYYSLLARLSNGAQLAWDSEIAPDSWEITSTFSAIHLRTENNRKRALREIESKL